MANKRVLGKIYDPKEDITHIVSPPFADQVTLCGQTDWLGQERGVKDPETSVNCKHCKWIFDFCRSGAWPS